MVSGAQALPPISGPLLVDRSCACAWPRPAACLTASLRPTNATYRLTFATSQGGGWIANAHDGNKYLNNNRWSVRGQLLFTPVAT